MGFTKCCVGGCFATSKTHRLYNMPSNDNLRNLWMSLLVPTNPKKKDCTLVFDEVALTPHLKYNEKKDKIHGFVDVTEERQQKIADHSLVFMIRGICSSWRQSIAYYFCEGTVSPPQLQNILKEIIHQHLDIGLKPLGPVCNQGSTFRSCINNLKHATARLGRKHVIRGTILEIKEG